MENRTYRLRYTIPFAGDGVDYRVELYQALAITDDIPNVVELDGGPSPFVVSLDNSDDPMLPIKTAMATISFVDDIDINEIRPCDAYEWKVQLIQVEYEILRFTGFVTGDVFTQPYVAGPNIITINAVSSVAPALAQELPQDTAGAITVGGVIAELARLSTSIMEVYIPACYKTNSSTGDEGLLAPMAMKFSSVGFMRLTDDPQLEGMQYVCDTYSDVLTAICNLFGWSMQDVGHYALYFTAAGYTGEYIVLTIDELERAAAGELFYPNREGVDILPVDSISAIDINDVMDVRKGVGSAVLNVSTVGVEVSLPSIERQVTLWATQKKTTSAFIERHNSSELDYDTGWIENIELERISEVSPGLVTLHAWRPENITLDEDNHIHADYTPVDTVNPATDLYCEYMENDVTNELDLPPDGDKRSWDLDRFYRIHPVREKYVNGTAVHLTGSGRKMISYIANAGVIRKGYLCLNFEMRATVGGGLHIPEAYYVAGPGLNEDDYAYPGLGYIKGYVSEFWPDNSKEVAVRLRIGEKWWSGTEWVAYAASFKILVSSARAEWHPILTNKTIEDMCEGSSGWFIPIDETLCGDLELTIFCPAVYAYPAPEPPISDPGWLGLGDWNVLIDIRGLNLQFKPDISGVDYKPNEVAYKRAFGNSRTETHNVNLRLHSSISSGIQSSLVFTGDMNRLTRLYRGSKFKKPEEFLLDDYQRIFAEDRVRYRRGMRVQKLNPLRYWREKDGRVLTMTGGSIDYAEGTGEIYMTDIKEMEI